MTFQLFPSLEPAIEDALRESIERFGVLVPIVVDQDDRVLDGYNRQRIAAALGVECPSHQVHVRDDDHAAELARTMNMDRRHIDAEQRREIVGALRATGHSLRAIAGATGSSEATVRRDLEIAPPDAIPDRVTRRGGGTYPSSRPRPGDVLVDDAGEPHLIAEVEEIDDTGELLIIDAEEDPQCIIVPAEPDLDDEELVEPQRLRKTDLGGGVAHPAAFSDGLLPIFAEFLEPGWRVLDPFAGTGKIHRLQELAGVETVGVELEPEWALLHPDTQIGDALDLKFEDESFDAVVTSPTYGNRLADHHEAYDPESRRSYRHDLGRALHPANSGSLQWGPKYRAFHRDAWEEALRVLRPGGTFVLNIKDHVRGGKRQAVSAWHHITLLELGCVFVDCVPFGTGGLRNGVNHLARVDAELVWVFTKEVGR